MKIIGIEIVESNQTSRLFQQIRVNNVSHAIKVLYME